MTLRRLAALLAVLAVGVPAAAQEPTVQLETRGTTGTITASGQFVTLSDIGGLASLAIQTTGTVVGLTWELQCSVDGTTFDADDEVPVTLVSSTPAAADAITSNAEAIYTASVAGCMAARIASTAYSSGSLVFKLTAITSGGGSGGGGGGAASTVSGTGTAGVAATGVLTVQGIASGVSINTTCSNCSGTGVSANEDTAFAASAAVTPAGSQRQDSLSTDTDVTGDVQPLKGDAFGRLYVTGTGGTFPSVSGTAASDAPVSGNPLLTAGRASAAAPTDVSTDGDVVAPWLLRSGAQVVQDSFAGVLGVAGNGASGTGVQRVTIANDSTGILATVGTVTTVSTVTNVATIGTSITPGTATTNLGKAEDAVAGTGDVGVEVLGHIQSVPAATAADGDLGTIKLDLLGKQWGAGAYPEDLASATLDPLVAMGCIRRDTTPSSSSGTAADYSNCNVDANGRLYVQSVLYNSSGTELTPSADSTHGSAILTTGPSIMFEATTALTSDTAVTDGQATRGKADTLGRQITVAGCGRQDRVRGQATITDGSSTSVLAAQGANIIAEIYEIEIVNTSAVDVSVDIRDGTAGSVLWTLMAPATTDTGGGNNRTFTVPLTFTANTAVAADPSGAATSVIVSVMGCKVL